MGMAAIALASVPMNEANPSIAKSGGCNGLSRSTSL
jgi:hypothetical protein